MGDRRWRIVTEKAVSRTPDALAGTLLPLYFNTDQKYQAKVQAARVLGVWQGAEHAVTVDQQLAAMTLDIASGLVHSVPRFSDPDGSASIFTCNTGAGSKTHRAAAFRVFPNV
jgi:hypothetical protein